MATMTIWVVEFSNGGYKTRIFFPKNQHTQRKLLNFENWVNGEVSKTGHHFRKFSDLKIDVLCTKLIFFNEKKLRKILIIFDLEN